MTDSYTPYHPSRVFKYCPYCGMPDFLWQGEKSFRCNSCGSKLYINEAAAVVAIIENPQGELLLTRRKKDPCKGMLDLPGGFVDIGERAEDALRRELMEELNLVAEELSYWGSYPNRYVYGGLLYFTLDMVFLCSVKDLSEIIPMDDVEDYLMMPVEELNISEVGLESVKNILLDYTQNR